MSNSVSTLVKSYWLKCFCHFPTIRQWQHIFGSMKPTTTQYKPRFTPQEQWKQITWSIISAKNATRMCACTWTYRVHSWGYHMNRCSSLMLLLYGTSFYTPYSINKSHMGYNQVNMQFHSSLGLHNFSLATTHHF